MNISLTPELEKFVQQKVNSGMYHSASEVIRDGLRLLQEREQLRQLKLEELRQDILRGVNSGKSTQLDIEDVIRRGKERLAQQTRNLEEA